MIDMFKSIAKWLSGVKDALSLVSTQKPIYVISHRVPQTFDILYIYIVPGISPQYKLVLDPTDGKVLHQKFIDKLFTSQDPIEELATGIHDKAIGKFIGTPFNGKEVTK